MLVWNPWHGCHKYSEGCQNCYVYRRDGSIGKDASVVTKTKSFDFPTKLYKNGKYKIAPGSHVYTCMTSDFFIDEADLWRNDIWKIIHERYDVYFTIITKRIVRFKECIPDDWGNGYPNVTIGCTIENQKQCDIRFPIFKKLPIKNKFIICEPILGEINLNPYIDQSIKFVSVGGESGPSARICDYNWVLNIRSQCVEKNVPFYFKQTGASFKKGIKAYNIPRKYQMHQADKADINTIQKSCLNKIV